MNMFFWGAIIVIVIGFVWSTVDMSYGWQWPVGSTFVACVFAVMGFFYYINHTPAALVAAAKTAADKKAALIPHVVREFDGCKVYRWRNSDNDHWHYVTKCPETVITESNRNVPRRVGKTTVYDTVTETIQTER